jgi:hypothetical protein
VSGMRSLLYSDVIKLRERALSHGEWALAEALEHILYLRDRLKSAIDDQTKIELRQMLPEGRRKGAGISQAKRPKEFTENIRNPGAQRRKRDFDEGCMAQKALAVLCHDQ